MHPPESIEQQHLNVPSTHVRFTRTEYLRLKKDQILTGKSIPWLLKNVYFEKSNFNPSLDLETRKAVRRDIANIGNNINQATRYLHMGLVDEFKSRFEDALHTMTVLRSFLGLGHGNRKDTV